MNPQTPKKEIETTQTEKLPYQAPQATFIPLKLEERLLACVKSMGGCPPGPDDLS